MGEVTVREVQVSDRGVEETGQLRSRHCSSLEENSPQGVLQVTGQRLDLSCWGTACWAKIVRPSTSPLPVARSLSRESDRSEGNV